MYALLTQLTSHPSMREVEREQMYMYAHLLIGRGSYPAPDVLVPFHGHIGLEASGPLFKQLITITVLVPWEHLFSF